MTKLQEQLAEIAPSILIETIWEHDPDLHDIRKECDGFDDEDPDDWQAWQSEVKATAIDAGKVVSGSAYLGGTWERSGDHPSESNPEISGYEGDMTREALQELQGLVTNELLREQIDAALAFLSA